MRTLYCSIFLLFVTCICASGAQKAVTQDPNAGGAVATKVEQVVDERLAQKVTYQSGYKRLHNVTDELTASTGVNVFCGQSSKNWKVRDIPLVVCVEDMPLGKLLDVIAGTTHTSLTSSKPEGEQDRYYRISRNIVAQRKLDDYFIQQQQAQRILAEWNWEILAGFKDIPSSSLKGASDTLKELGLLSTALSNMGPDTRDRFLAGDYLWITPDTSVGADLIRLIDRQDWERTPKDRRTPTYEELSDEKLAECRYGIKLLIQNNNTRSVDIERQIRFNNGGASTSRSAISNMISDIASQRNVRAQRVTPSETPEARDARAAEALATGKIPPGPKAITPPEPAKIPLPERPNLNDFRMLDDDPPGPGFQRVQFFGPDTPEALRAKIRIELPEGITDPSWAEMVQAVAKASGYDIVAEDFYSHRYSIQGSLRALINTETTVLEVLKALNCTWWLDENAKMLVGWNLSWRPTHACLLSESMLEGLHAKLNGPGVELADLVPVMGLTYDQASTWITDNRSLNPLTASQFVDPDYGPLWMLYSMLDAPHQAQARSDAGLRFGGIDQKWLLGALATMRKYSSERVHKVTIGSGANAEADLNDALSDPNILQTLTMKVKRLPQEKRWEVTVKDGCPRNKDLADAPDDSARHTYTIELTGEKNGAAVTFKTEPLRFAFPIYSPEREKEILNQK